MSMVDMPVPFQQFSPILLFNNIKIFLRFFLFCLESIIEYTYLFLPISKNGQNSLPYGLKTNRYKIECKYEFPIGCFAK